MVLKATVQFGDATAPVTVPSPKLVGLSSLERLARLLDGEGVESVFSSAASLLLPTGFVPFYEGQRELVGILVNDAPPGTPRRVTRMFVAAWSLTSTLR